MKWNPTRVTVVIWGIGLAAAAFLAQRAIAGGIPTTNALSYAGTLEDATGAPLTGSHNIEVKLWSVATGGTMALCTTNPQAITLQNGRFSVSMDACVAAVRANSEVWVEVLDNGTSLGRTKAGAVPFAVEAAHAMAADTATTTPLAARATTADSAASASVAQTAMNLGGTPAAGFQRTVTGSCATGSSIRAIAADGTTVTCQPDRDTTYSAGPGLSLTGTAFGVDTSQIQGRVTGTCQSGAIGSINADGSVTCNLRSQSGIYAPSITSDGSTLASKVVRGGTIRWFQIGGIVCLQGQVTIGFTVAGAGGTFIKVGLPPGLNGNAGTATQEGIGTIVRTAGSSTAIPAGSGAIESDKTSLILAKNENAYFTDGDASSGFSLLYVVNGCYLTN
jgi:hypothetical protein